MRKIIVNEFMSLDGVVQAPGGEDEDTSGGFRHGGWHMQYMDDVSRPWVLGGIVEAGGFLLGRGTYEIFAAYWPNAPEEEEVIAEPLNSKPKWVASTTPGGELEWQNSTVLEGDLPSAVEALKREDGDDIHVIGSPQLVRALLENDLVDELRLMIDPVMLGGGKRPFPDDGELRPMRLVERDDEHRGDHRDVHAGHLKRVPAPPGHGPDREVDSHQIHTGRYASSYPASRRLLRPRSSRRSSAGTGTVGALVGCRRA